MKKTLLTLLLVLGLATNVLANPVNTTILAETRLDDDPQSVTSSAMNIQDYKKVAFFVDYDETEDSTVGAAFTIETSYDGTNWLATSFFDLAGGPATFVTSEDFTSDVWYVCWLDPNLNVPQVRVIVTSTNSDTNDLIDVTVYLAGIK